MKLQSQNHCLTLILAACLLPALSSCNSLNFGEGLDEINDTSDSDDSTSGAGSRSSADSNAANSILTPAEPQADASACKAPDGDKDIISGSGKINVTKCQLDSDLASIIPLDSPMSAQIEGSASATILVSANEKGSISIPMSSTSLSLEGESDEPDSKKSFGPYAILSLKVKEDYKSGKFELKLSAASIRLISEGQVVIDDFEHSMILQVVRIRPEFIKNFQETKLEISHLNSGDKIRQFLDLLSAIRPSDDKASRNSGGWKEFWKGVADFNKRESKGKHKSR